MNARETRDFPEPDIENTGRTGGDPQSTNNNSAGSGGPGFEPLGGNPMAEATAEATAESDKALRDAPARQGGPLGPGAGPFPKAKTPERVERDVAARRSNNRKSIPRVTA